MDQRHYSHIPDVRMANAAALDIARRVLPPSVRTFSSCSCVTMAIAQLRTPAQGQPGAKGAQQQRQERQEQQERIGIVTSPRAIRKYDPAHPERIAFILVRSSPPPQYMVITNDRQLDVERIVRFWLVGRHTATATATAMECVVCSRSLLPRPRRTTTIAEEADDAEDDDERSDSSEEGEHGKQGAPHSRCFFCHAPLCVPCGDRLTTFDGCHRCPVCRQWRLNGSDFGVPFAGGGGDGEDAADHDHHSDPVDPVDVLCDRVLSRLDGRVRIVPRIGDGFVMERMSVMAKMSRTARYCPDDDDGIEDDEDRVRVPRVRRDLKFIRSAAVDGAPIHVWVRRKTYAIDALEERPVEEAAVFYIRGRRLLQLRPDAWVDVLGELLQDMRSAAAEKTGEMWREIAAEGRGRGHEEGEEEEKEEERAKMQAEAEEEAKRTMAKAAWAFTTRRVAYLPPHEFAFPDALREAVVAATGSQTVTSVSVEVEKTEGDAGAGADADGSERRRRRRSMGMSYEADRSGDPTTATIPFVAARFWVLVDTARAVGKPSAELSVIIATWREETKQERRFTCIVDDNDVVSLC